MQAREKVGKSRNIAFFQRGSGESKSRLAKAAGAETSGEMKDEKLHPVVVRMQNYLLTNLGATERLFYLSQNVVAQGMH